MHTQDKISSDQAFYDNEPVSDRAQHEIWMREIQFYFNSYAERLNSQLLGTTGLVAELGAGSCGLSACLSRLPNVRQVKSLDISMARMKKMIDLSSEVLGADSSKIVPIAADFNNRLPFGDGELDVVVFDAALHHSRSMWHLLSECRRVLRQGGLLVAQRESYLSPLRARRQLENLLRTPEIAANVSENMYLRAQYEYYLNVHGFMCEFIPCSPNMVKRFLRPLNGSLFSDGVIWCENNDVKKQ